MSKWYLVLIAATLSAFISGFAIGFATHMYAVEMKEPHCPTEDSCIAVFENGEYRIKEIVP